MLDAQLVPEQWWLLIALFFSLGDTVTRKAASLDRSGPDNHLGRGLGSFQCYPGPRGLGLSCAVGTSRRVLGDRQRQQFGLLDQ